MVLYVVYKKLRGGEEREGRKRRGREEACEKEGS